MQPCKQDTSLATKALSANALAQTKNLTIFLREKCAVQGTIGVDIFHHHCLHHPLWGYYRTQDVLARSVSYVHKLVGKQMVQMGGVDVPEDLSDATSRIKGQHKKEGDFCTAPELSSLFNDVWGAVLVDAWQRCGAPEKFVLLELGPGRGTLMDGILRVGALVPAFLKAAQVVLCEVHPLLQVQQEEKLASWKKRVGGLHWVQTLDDALRVTDTLAVTTKKPAPLFVVANEFFDVLPARVFEKTTQGWCEKKIAWCEGENGFVWTRGACFTPSFLPAPQGYRQGQMFEYSPACVQTMQALLACMQKRGGMMLVCDYGYMGHGTQHPGFEGLSWQGLFQGKPVEPLQHPGLTDLSFHVDFGLLGRHVKQALHTVHMMTQRDFLHHMGFGKRLEKAMQTASTTMRAQLQVSAIRLTHPLHMGTLFNVLWAEHFV